MTPKHLLALALLLSSACSPDEPPPAANDPSPVTSSEPPAPLRTDRPSYSLVREGVGWRTDIAVEFHNTFPDMLYAINCNGALTLAVERRVGATWETFWAPLTNGCLSLPVKIPPDGRLELPLALWGAPPGSNAGPQFADTTFTGTYRLLWWNLVSGYDVDRRELGDSIPVRYRISNEFSLGIGVGG